MRRAVGRLDVLDVVSVVNTCAKNIKRVISFDSK